MDGLSPHREPALLLSIFLLTFLVSITCLFSGNILCSMPLDRSADVAEYTSSRMLRIVQTG